MPAAKALSFANELMNALAHRGFVVSLSYDTDSEPLVRVGANAAAGQQTALIKVKEWAPVGVDAVGLPARGYTPLIAQIVLETSTIANVALLVEASKLSVYGELGHRGVYTELYMVANGVATSSAGIVSGNLKLAFWPDPKYQMTLSQ